MWPRAQEAEQRAADQRLADEAEQRAADQRLAEERAANQRLVDEMFDPPPAHLTGAALQKLVQLECGLKATAVKGVFKALITVLHREVPRRAKVTINGVAVLKMEHKAATKASKKKMFGNEFDVAAKPARVQVKACTVKALKEALYGDA